ncbi:hypothetical protein AC579_4695 [Pseudocercospora musae]|uniref:Uncharacterized protein n=1 Tax=Pseudocercospora musae TaxID=113226 RepID=A0A139IBD3_9PEZI|nr:hypothetical protein AC579_4695 [Pseudocercospora musae]
MEKRAPPNGVNGNTSTFQSNPSTGLRYSCSSQAITTKFDGTEQVPAERRETGTSQQRDPIFLQDPSAIALGEAPPRHKERADDDSQKAVLLSLRDDLDDCFFDLWCFSRDLS